MEEVMVRWLLILTLSVVSSTVSAQAGQVIHPAVATDNAETIAKGAEHRVAQLAQRRTALAKRYQDELGAIDRLKKQRASWHHDRELRDSLSSSAETANQLSAASHDLEKAPAGLARARRAYLAAIEAELDAGAVPMRALQLGRAKGQLSPLLKDAPRRIVFPDLEVDLLADPEELDQRAVELRASEEELNRQLVRLGAQAAELDHFAMLRKQHDRAGYLIDRDDDQPHRNTTHRPSERAADDGPSSGWDYSHLPASADPPPSTFESYVSIVLSDVIDASTINSFAAAQRSGDPMQRAEAAHKAHDAVARRLEQVRKKRTEIEARSRQLRAKR
jgi:hypothetical protein